MFIKNCFETFDLFAICGFSFVRHASLFILADPTHPTCLSVKFKACASSAFLLSKKNIQKNISQKSENSGQPPDGDVAAVVELLLQLQPLAVGVHNPVLVLCSRSRWKTKL